MKPIGILKCKLEKNQRYVLCPLKENQLWRPFYASGFGTLQNDLLQLTIYEALYLLRTNRILLLDKDGKKLSFDDILNILRGEDYFIYLAYQEIRNRGFTLRSDFLEDIPFFKIYKRGALITNQEPFAYIYVTLSLKAIKMSDLSKLLEKASNDGKKLLIVVIDELGDLTTYEVSQVLLKETKLKVR